MLDIIAIASDHGGFVLKEKIIDELESLGYIVENLGTHSDKHSVDYPVYARCIARSIDVREGKKGILICGTGIGMSIVANKHKGIRAALCHNSTTARLAREHNDANVLVLGARVIGEEVAKECARVFLESEFQGGRHAERVSMIEG